MMMYDDANDSDDGINNSNSNGLYVPNYHLHHHYQ